MRPFLFSLIVLIGFVPSVPAERSQDKPFVVIELFSSEGCSSCPPADQLVSQLTAWARRNHQLVYPLIFHVDYWNNLGWTDAFSKPEFTQRQYHYARIFQDQGVYTPQMIVNGSDAFVGADQEHLQNDMNQELTKPTSVLLNISYKKHNSRIIVSYNVTGFADHDVVNIALLERGLSSQVTAGENAGRTLHHDNVVRQFQTQPLSEGSMQATVPLNNTSDLSQSSVIVYVQDPQTMKIKAAKQMDLSNG